MQLLRSLIFVPGNRANMLERALGFNADIIMVGRLGAGGGKKRRPGPGRSMGSRLAPGR